MSNRMPCSVSADLRQYEAAQERAESLHDAYADEVIQDIVDDLMGGRKVNKWTIHDFKEEMDDDDFALLMTAQGPESIHKLREIQGRVEERIRRFIEEHCPELIAERVADRDEDARADAAESRHAVREAI